MRATTLFSLSMALFLTGNAQERFISSDFTRFYDWFHEHAQTELLYTHQATLYIFEYETPIRQSPCLEGEILGHLSIGQKVSNFIPNSDFYTPTEDQINGYDDLWYPVKAHDSHGQEIEGFVWGAHIAKGWRRVDLTFDQEKELILLGISSRPRTEPEDINAEIRILKGDHLLAQQQIPGLCLFEECQSSALLRIIQDSIYPELIVLEASTLTVACDVSIEKNFYYWDGFKLINVLSGEFAFNPTYTEKSFTLNRSPSRKGTVSCSLSYLDENFNPVWDFKVNSGPVVRVKNKVNTKAK